MAWAAPVPYESLSVAIDQGVVDGLRLAVREAVNVSALAITEDARRRVRSVLGAAQRLSRLTTRKRPDATGRYTKVSRVKLSTIEAGGTRINPYYRPALSVRRPVALVGARGPAHLIEHNRRGGYDVRPNRGPVGQGAAEDVAALQAQLFGRTATERAATEARLQRRPALRTGVASDGNPMGDYAVTRPGPILRPYGGPITAAFRAGPQTIQTRAQQAVDETMARNLAGFGPLGARVRDVLVP